jgi:tripartite-type tricarboxylate transporter receptor subunit TctC
MFTDLARTAALVVAAASLAAPAHAQSPDPPTYYKTHTVRFISGGGPGGGYDNYARMLAPHLATELATNVVVENQPAAGGLVGLNRIYANEPDGLQFIIMNGGGAVMSQLFDLQTVQYDLAKTNFLATVSSSPWVVLVNTKSPYKSMADLVKAGTMIRWPATGPIDGLSDGASMLCAAYQMQCRVVLGYKSSSEGALAVERGEMDALYVSDTSANNYIKNGEARPIAVVSRERSRFLPDMPTIFEQGGLTDAQKWWLEARADVDALGRIIIAGPNVQPDRMAYLQAAVKKITTDPIIRAEGDKLERYLDFQSPEATRNRALGLINGVTGERKAMLKDVVMRKYLPGAN